MTVFTRILLTVLRAARWPRRRLDAWAAGCQYHLAWNRVMSAELGRAPDYPAQLGSMLPDADQAAAPPPDPRRFGGPDFLPEAEEWTDEALRRLKEAIDAAPPPTRRATAQDWYDAYGRPDFDRCLAAEQASFARWLERETARFHHGRRSL